jgi:hypothetical protein
LDNPVWLDKAGEIVQSDEVAHGLKSFYQIIHPSKLIFVDEVGNKTPQTKDGNRGGKNLLVHAT